MAWYVRWQIQVLLRYSCYPPPSTWPIFESLLRQITLSSTVLYFLQRICIPALDVSSFKVNVGHLSPKHLCFLKLATCWCCLQGYLLLITYIAPESDPQDTSFDCCEGIFICADSWPCGTISIQIYQYLHGERYNSTTLDFTSNHACKLPEDNSSNCS